VTGVLDFHNHLMPGVDDGAQTNDETIVALERFKQDGVTAVIATPHFDGSITTQRPKLESRMRDLDISFIELRHCAEQVGGVRVERGVELLLDVPEPDLSDVRLRLAGGKFFLMEFPYMSVPPHSTHVVHALSATSYRPIIAHPERYHGIGRGLDLAGDWKQNGAYLQVNGGSLIGRYGPEAREAALELLRRGWVDYICSDYHARGPALIAQYRAFLENNGAAEQAHTLLQTNPNRILAGQVPLPVAPLQIKRSMWGRVTAIFRS
jgi:protein-tyrosine phosphatase